MSLSEKDTSQIEKDAFLEKLRKNGMNTSSIGPKMRKYVIIHFLY